MNQEQEIKDIQRRLKSLEIRWWLLIISILLISIGLILMRLKYL